MPAIPIPIPDPLPPAITLPRKVIEFAIEQHLDEYGVNSLVAKTWQWVLHGGGLGPISHMDWRQVDGDRPPSAATLAAESTAEEPPLAHRTPWAELNKARFICWWCTAQPSDATPRRFQLSDARDTNAVTKSGSVRVTIGEDNTQGV